MEKNLKCPMCDSSDFKEENGYYVCQVCGNKIPIQSKTDEKPKKTETAKHMNCITAKDATIIKVVSLLIELGLFLGEMISIILALGTFEQFDSYTKMVYIFGIIYCLSLLAFIAFSVLEWRGKVVPFAAKNCVFAICCLSLIVPAFISTITYQAYNSLISSYTTLLTVYLLVYQCPKWIKHSLEKES